MHWLQSKRKLAENLRRYQMCLAYHLNFSTPVNESFSESIHGYIVFFFLIRAHVLHNIKQRQRTFYTDILFKTNNSEVQTYSIS